MNGLDSLISCHSDQSLAWSNVIPIRHGKPVLHKQAVLFGKGLNVLPVCDASAALCATLRPRNFPTGSLFPLTAICQLLL